MEGREVKALPDFYASVLKKRERGKKPIHLVINLKNRLFIHLDVINHMTIKQVVVHKHSAHTLSQEEGLQLSWLMWSRR